MSIWNKAVKSYSALKSPLSAAFQHNPVGFIITVIVLLIGVMVTFLMVSLSQMATLSSAIHLLPALVVFFDNLRRREPRPDRWPGWLVIASVTIAGTTILHLFSSSIHEFAYDVRAITTPLAIMILILTVLPRTLSLLAEGLGHVPFAGTFLLRWLPAPTLYVLICLPCIITLMTVVILKNFNWGLFLLLLLLGSIVSISCVYFRSSFFSVQGKPLFMRVLPHVAIWLYPVSFLLMPNSGLLLFNSALCAVFISGCFCALVLTVPFVLMMERLRQMPVCSLPEPNANRPDSIQSKVHHYMDVRGRSARLVDSIKRMDAGVFGVTGVRGAGKSALTRHVLKTLVPYYFTLEITAPVRHDQGMGFFISVCRAVCGRTLETLGPIVTGSHVTISGTLWKKLRNLLLAGVAAVAVILLLAVFAPNYIDYYKDIETTSIHQSINDSMHSFDTPWVIVENERAIIDHLLLQISFITDNADADGQTDSNKSQYLLVPAAVAGHFWLLPLTSTTNVKSQLYDYKRRLESGYPHTIEEVLCTMDMREELKRKYHYYGGFGSIRFWRNSMDKLRRKQPLFVPLGYLQTGLRHHLFTAAAKHRKLCSTKKPPQPEFLSQLILKAFFKADARLAFDVSRLRKFRDIVQVYRRMLDGDVVPRVAPATEKGSGSVPSDKRSIMQGLSPYNWPIGTSFCATVALFLLILGALPAWRTFSGFARAVLNRRYLDLYAEALDFMEHLSYTSNQEMSAGLSWQGIGLERKRTFAARDLTLPNLTARYTSFLAKLRMAYNGKVIIAIDELDKIHDPEQVKALLSEIKGGLFVEGTFYLISVSEDAARSFRRRLASGRDIFESTFDDIVDIRQMNVDAAVSMLQKLEEDVPREERLGTECLEVAALFGGGIPREIIRARREISSELRCLKDGGATPWWAAQTLMQKDLSLWIEHLGEANLSGEDTIRLRRYAQVAMDSLNSNYQYAEVWNALQPCLDIIDPDGLRKNVGYIVESGGLQAGSEQTARNESYRRIQSDLQAVLRLMILTNLSELITQPNTHRNTYEASILECHRALADKPALAEMLLFELREQKGLVHPFTHKLPPKH